MTDPLPAALLELLAAGPRTPTQLQQQLADAGAPMHFEVVVAALRKLKGSGHVEQYSDGTWRRAESVTRPQDTQETTVPTKTCPACKATKDATEFYGNGYCKPCGREKAKAYAQKDAKPAKPAAPAKPAKVAAKAVRAEKREPAPSRSVTIARLLTIKLRDANEVEHVLVLTDSQADELRQALA